MYLHVLFTGAKTYHKLQSGKFSSVVCHEEHVYAANYHASQVWRFTINNDAGFKLVIVTQVVIPEGWTTLSVKEKSILCCNRDLSEVYLMLIESTGSSAPSVIPVPAPQGTSTKREPYICDDADDRTVMICDRRHNQIMVLTNYFKLTSPLVVGTNASRIAALKDRKNNFLLVVHTSPDVLTVHDDFASRIEAKCACNADKHVDINVDDLD